MPHRLRGKPLTARLLRDHGIAVSRLQRGDVITLGSGIYLERETAEALGTEGCYRAKAFGLVHEYPGSWLSHTTAVRLQGLPPRTRVDDVVHLSVPATHRNPVRRQGVVGHKAAAYADEVLNVQGTSMSAPHRMWCESAAELSVEGLVVLGDSLVRRPRPRFEGRKEPLASLESLRTAIRRHGRAPGRAKARAAADLIRVGADSAQETLLRLAILRAGLPEPELQVPADPRLSTSPCADLGYPRWRIAIQYDGACHFDPERAKRDRRVDRQFHAQGWTVLRYFDADARDGFRGAVREIAQILEQHR
ncbi:endonuclease domain-containing protein [Nesterenkonia haasae]|uniref:endonuclease domain-containing protein n=1 Tax=Nesterenkonia haasae TaxID=2587813 RepID=UPI00139074DB|nr:hypothetical protein [Nesterenkonia haasae]NDK31042.1 hypothetical protein [Nesterenkonia haasae]